MRQHFKRGIALLFIASSNQSERNRLCTKVRVINQDTGEPIIGAISKGQGVQAVTDEEGYFTVNNTMIRF